MYASLGGHSVALNSPLIPDHKLFSKLIFADMVVGADGEGIDLKVVFNQLMGCLTSLHVKLPADQLLRGIVGAETDKTKVLQGMVVQQQQSRSAYGFLNSRRGGRDTGSSSRGGCSSNSSSGSRSISEQQQY